MYVLVEWLQSEKVTSAMAIRAPVRAIKLFRKNTDLKLEKELFQIVDLHWFERGCLAPNPGKPAMSHVNAALQLVCV